MAEDTIENPYKVRLIAAGSSGDRVSFDASPSVSETRSVNYTSLEPLHAPGQIQVYKNTASRNFQLSDVKLISRTVKEADKNMQKLWILRSWCMPRFGNNSTTLSAENRRLRNHPLYRNPTTSKFKLTAEQRGVELLGAPPAILYLSAYSRKVGETSSDKRSGNVNVWQVTQHINRVPVVLQQLSIPYPNDTDYVTNSDGTPMPSIMNIELTLVETHSPNSYEGFSLDDFKKGILQGF